MLARTARNNIDRQLYYQLLASLAAHYGFDIERPFEALAEEHRQIVLYGSGREKIAFRYLSESGRSSIKEHAFEGIIHNLERRYKETDSVAVREELAKYLNTRRTAAFTKGEHLFGLTESTREARAASVPVLVEGPLDAIAVTIATQGSYIGVSALGTAFTEAQAEQFRDETRSAPHFDPQFLA